MSTYDGDYMKDTLERTIRRELTDKAREEGYAQAMRDVIAMKQSEYVDDPEYVYVYDIESLAGYKGIDLEGNKP